MRWVWDPVKNQRNKRKHGLSFDTAQLVFLDPLALSQPDPSVAEARWQTIGVVGRVTILVVHTWPNQGPRDVEPVGRIISARKATRHERKAYEES